MFGFLQFSNDRTVEPSPIVRRSYAHCGSDLLCLFIEGKESHLRPFRCLSGHRKAFFFRPCLGFAEGQYAIRRTRSVYQLVENTGSFRFPNWQFEYMRKSPPVFDQVSKEKKYPIVVRHVLGCGLKARTPINIPQKRRVSLIYFAIIGKSANKFCHKVEEYF